MEDKMYKVGTVKENIFLFSKESNAFFILKEILKEINSPFYQSFINLEPIEISNSKEIELVLAKLKINLMLSFNHKYYQNDNNYLSYISNYKKEIAHLRDNNSKDIRGLIKLYSTLFFINKKYNKITFNNYSPDGASMSE